MPAFVSNLLPTQQRMCHATPLEINLAKVKNARSPTNLRPKQFTHFSTPKSVTLRAERVLPLKPKIVNAAIKSARQIALAQIRQAGVQVELFSAEHRADQVLENVGRIAKFY